MQKSIHGIFCIYTHSPLGRAHSESRFADVSLTLSELCRASLSNLLPVDFTFNFNFKPLS